jgi:hypothetical protein
MGMNKILSLTLVLFIALRSVDNLPAMISVGVNEGDWIEYQVTFTGVPVEKHDVTWAKMEIVAVDGTQIELNITVKFSDGTSENQPAILNLEMGQLGDAFLITANLNKDDMFFDKNVGNITIIGAEERTYAGSTRTVVYATTAEITYYWDKGTGVLVEGISQFPNYTINSIIDKTNIWQPQIIGMDQRVFYAITIGATMLIGVAVMFLIVRRKKYVRINNSFFAQLAQ